MKAKDSNKPYPQSSRAARLRAAKREYELAEAGLTRKRGTVKKGNVIEAQYTLQPQIIFSNNNYDSGKR